MAGEQNEAKVKNVIPSRLPIAVTAEDIELLESEIFEHVRSFFTSRLPHRPKRGYKERRTSDGLKYEMAMTTSTDEVNAARLAVTMTSAALDALWRTNSITIVVVNDNEAQDDQEQPAAESEA